MSFTDSGINKAGAWTVVEGTIHGDGSISMTVTKDMLSSLKNDEFVIGVVSKLLFVKFHEDQIVTINAGKNAA